MRGNQILPSSPRVRGNPGAALTGRSIPARAGEPQHRTAASIADSGLSPRVRGNLVSVKTVPEGLSPRVRWQAGGLSPRVRGNRTSMAGHEHGLSPRVRGNQGESTGCLGLMRPVPGSIPARAGGTSQWGSIPARAGEPAFLGAYDGSIPARAGEPVRYTKVYPRACGGTA